MDPPGSRDRIAGAAAFYAGGLSVATYDLFSASRPSPLAGDIDFYARCAERVGGPVLELGAGTGRVAWQLAAAGHTVVGLDLSDAMLTIARRKAEHYPAEVRARVEFRRADMVDFHFARRFGLVLVPARAFQHLLTPNEQRAALGCIRRHLKRGGHLVIDLFDPLLEYCAPGAPLPAAREVLDPASERVIRRRAVARRADPLRQVVTETLCFEEIDPSGATIAAEETSWALRWTYRQEMAYLFELTGFDVVEQYSHFHGAPPDYGREQVWIASKR